MTRNAEAVQTTASLHAQVAAAHRTVLILVSALATSIIFMAAVGYLVLNVRQNPRVEPPYAFYAAAAVLAIGSIVIRRAQLHRVKLEVVAATRGVGGLIKHLVTSTILTAAIAETIGMIALIVAFFGGDRNDVVRLAVVALAISVYNYPRRSAWQRAADYFFETLPGSNEGQLGL